MTNEDEDQSTAADPSASEAVEANRKRRQRHVWIKDGEKLRAVKIEFGLSDGKHYELVEGELEEGQELVTGVEARRSR